MDRDLLINLGLSPSEATLYLALLKLGESDVQGLVNETGFYKANTYQALDRLCNKGIISNIVEGKKRFYQLQKPGALIEFVEKKKRKLEFQENLARDFARKVNLAKKEFAIQETAIVLRGIAGIKQIYSEIINNKLDYFVFGSPRESETIVGDFYWQNLHVKQKKFKIKAKMIFHKSLRYWKKMIPKEIIDLRFLNEKFESLTETTIYGTKVAFTVWTDKPIVTIINNEHVAKAYKQIFDILWRKSSR